MTEVLPAIIPQSFEDLKDKMALVKGIVKMVQIDICDGKFVPSKSWPYIGDEGEFENLGKEDEGFPFWQNMDFELDMMIRNPEEVSEAWIHAGAKALIFHIESSPKILDFIKELRKKYGYAKDTVAGIDIGVAISIETPNENLDDFMIKDEEGRYLVDFVQFMGIRKIGFQGQDFDEEILEKIKNFRKKYSDIIIGVDGAVNFDTYQDLVKAGANKLVSGSALYDSEDIKEAIEEMMEV
jgi:ribulose-phosphate 3-epimerase